MTDDYDYPSTSDCHTQVFDGRPHAAGREFLAALAEIYPHHARRLRAFGHLDQQDLPRRVARKPGIIGGKPVVPDGSRAHADVRRGQIPAGVQRIVRVPAPDGKASYTETAK